MPWFNEPKFIAIRKTVVDRLKKRKFFFRPSEPVVFLCGAAGSQRRETLTKYLKRHTKLQVFYADDVWKMISESQHNALQMEQRLAELADGLVILVESPGTFAELGAFAIHPKLRAKLLPILDAKYRYEESFVRSGPVKWVDQDSKIGPSIWVDFDSVLTCVGEVEDRFSSKKERSLTALEQLRHSPKHELLFVCDLLALFYPVTADDVRAIIAETIGDEPFDVEYYLSIATALEFARRVPHEDQTYYTRSMAGDHFPSFQLTRYRTFPELRSRILNVLQKIPEANGVLEALQGS